MTRPPHLLSENMLGGGGGQTAPRREGDADWIAADWGSTHLRLWLMQGADALDHRSSDIGTASLSHADFPAALGRAIEGWPDLPVIACGMVGSRQGWAEAPYAPTPCAATPRLTQIPGTRVAIVGGVSQSAPADVMRGEETQIAGILAALPDFDGVACLPGTHSKWARVSAGEICHFQSFMTGEIFALLGQKSVLRHSIGDPGDDDAFDKAVGDALSQPQRLAGWLFGLRAGALLDDLAPETAAARLSGWLIGWELAAAKPYWLGQQVVLIGAPRLAALYARALTAQGAAAMTGDAEAATLAGLHAAWQSPRTT